MGGPALAGWHSLPRRPGDFRSVVCTGDCCRGMQACHRHRRGPSHCALACYRRGCRGLYWRRRGAHPGFTPAPPTGSSAKRLRWRQGQPTVETGTRTSKGPSASGACLCLSGIRVRKIIFDILRPGLGSRAGGVRRRTRSGEGLLGFGQSGSWYQLSTMTAPKPVQHLCFPVAAVMLPCMLGGPETVSECAVGRPACAGPDPNASLLLLQVADLQRSMLDHA